jgi:heme a synthase
VTTTQADWKKTIRSADAFQKMILLTLGITFFLIFVGGLVRAAGAGLGCPDWPRCFGVWIPPLTVADLPAGYDPAEFNPIKTWLEYLNRLLGVAVGFCIVTTFLWSLKYRQSDKPIVIATSAALLLVLYQGWLGGQVVRSGLEGWMITVHMLVAILILNVLLFAAYWSFRDRLYVSSLAPTIRRQGLGILVALMVVTLIQITLGTQVREALTAIKNAYPDLPRAEWIHEVGSLDIIHRSFSWAVLIFTVLWYRFAKRHDTHGWLRLISIQLNTTLILQILLGVGLVYGGMPPAFQIFHLVLAAVMTSLQWASWLILFNKPHESSR